jgi:hypothetical protein
MKDGLPHFTLRDLGRMAHALAIAMTDGASQ